MRRSSGVHHMKDNLEIGSDAGVNHTLQMLRDGTSKGEITHKTEIAPGLFLLADPRFSHVSGGYGSPNGRLLELDVKPRGDGEWIGLHLSLSMTNLADKGVIGFACRIAAPELMIMRACVRSGTESRFTDAFFDKHILVQTEDTTHLDALPLYRQTGLLPVRAAWRELVFFLPTRGFQLSLIDLRVFAV